MRRYVRERASALLQIVGTFLESMAIKEESGQKVNKELKFALTAH